MLFHRHESWPYFKDTLEAAKEPVLGGLIRVLLLYSAELDAKEHLLRE